MTYMGKESLKRMDIYVCVTDSFCCRAETNTTLQINYTSIKLLKKCIRMLDFILYVLTAIKIY